MKASCLLVSCCFDRVTFNAVAFPDPSFIAVVGTRDNHNALGNHKRRIEANTKLANNIKVFSLCFCIVGLELETARMSNGAQIGFELFFGHTNTGIGNSDGTRFFVEIDINLKIVFANSDSLIGEAFEVELINRI